jgi:prepilin-type processing-associated H-X9-DG protein
VALAAIPEDTRTCALAEITQPVDRSWPTNYSTADRRFEPEFRHNDGLVMAFCDGHVKWLPRNKPGFLAPAAGQLTGTWWYPTATAP